MGTPLSFEERQAQDKRDRKEASSYLDMLANVTTVEELLSVVRLLASWAAKKMREVDE